MNTFILDTNIRKSTAYLDLTRLHKQAVEIKQILLALEPNSTSRWRNHPATKQWRRHKDYLAVYGIACVDAWLEAGFKSSLAAFFTTRIHRKISYFPDEFLQLIPLHRAYMLSKYLTHYRPLFPEVNVSLQYSTYLDSISYEPFQVIGGQRVYITANCPAC